MINFIFIIDHYKRTHDKDKVINKTPITQLNTLKRHLPVATWLRWIKIKQVPMELELQVHFWNLVQMNVVL